MGSLNFRAPLVKTLNIALFELTASLAPLKIQALPDFKHRPMQSLVTFGLDS